MAGRIKTVWRIVWITAVIFSGIACSGGSISNRPVPQVSSHIRQGDRYYQKEVFHRAYQNYLQARTYAKPDINIQLRLARAALAMGDVAKAEYHIRYAVKYCFNDPAGYVVLGHCLLYENIIAAEKAFIKARNCASGRQTSLIEAEIQHARSLRQFEDGADTITNLDNAMDLIKRGKIVHLTNMIRRAHTDDRQLLEEIINVCLRDGYNKEAIVLLGLEYELNATARTILKIGNIYFKTDNKTEAVRFYLQFIEKAADPSAGYINLGLIYLQAGFKKRSEQYFLKAGSTKNTIIRRIKDAFAQGRQLIPVE